MKTTGFLTLGLAIAVLGGCSPKSETTETTTTNTTTVTSYVGESAAASITSAEASALESAADLSSFTGKWTGPEGTYLTVTPQGPDYLVTVANLDGPRDFTGKATANGIAFTRDGQVLTIRKGTGEDTGMKWLAGKHDCIVVAANEGYCHD